MPPYSKALRQRRFPQNVATGPLCVGIDVCHMLLVLCEYRNFEELLPGLVFSVCGL